MTLEKKDSTISLSAKREAEKILARQKVRLSEAYRKYAEENEYVYWDDMTQSTSDREEWLKYGGNKPGNHILRKKNRNLVSLNEYIAANGNVEKAVRNKRDNYARSMGYSDYYDYISSLE